MNIKLVTIMMTVVLTVALLPGFSGVQAVANHPGMQEGAQQTPAPAPKRRKKRAGGARMKGVPKGVGKCLAHLEEMAMKDPMTPYEGHPAEVINNGLLWNDPKSNCSIGADSALRKKVSDLAVAWRKKETEKVRTLISELKTAAPQQ